MKKFYCLISALFLSLILLSSSLMLPFKTTTTTFADQVIEKIDSPEAIDDGDTSGEEGEEEPPLFVEDIDAELLQYFHISQNGDGNNNGYVFTENDFVNTNIDGVTAALFTNKTVTMYCDYNFEEDERAEFTFSVNSQPIIDRNIVIEEESPYLKQLNGKNYFVFDISKLEIDSQTRIFVRLTFNNVDHDLLFRLVQTPRNIKTAGITWQYNDTSTTSRTITAPTMGCTYPPLTLTIPNGSTLNPIYVHFVYCGESFEFYNINGVLYNSLDDQVLTFLNNKIVFDVSGTYQIEIYDKTSLVSFPDNNFLSYDFSIDNNESSSSRFYYSAYVEDGSIIMNNQIANDTTIVEFKNIEGLRIQNIEVRRTYTSYGENVPVTTQYSANDIISNGGKLSFDEDGIYRIRMFTSSSDFREFNFTILRSIRNQFVVDKKVYGVDPTEPSNVTKTFNITREVETTYPSTHCPITSMSSYSFNVTVARSAPSIDGIPSSKGNVSLVVRGVGTINVSITKDGKTVTRQYNNGDVLPTISEPGRYTVRITDQMGSIATRSFTINIKMNGAATILVCIAAVAVVFVIIMIFVSRMKVKVR